MKERPVVTERRDQTLVIKLNRPAARNAINLETAELVGAAMAKLDADDEIAVGVLTGAGGTFCAGMDLKAFLAGERAEIPARGFGGLVESPPDKPLIAAVEGYALAGGFELALACDLIVAAEDAAFGIPEVKRSLVAVGGALIRLPLRMPYNVAMELALTGRMLEAASAHELGVVNRLAPPGEALEAALGLAAEIAENGPLAVRASKQIMRRAGDWTEAEAFAAQRPIADPVFDSEDAREGARAFAEKRPPHWRGR
jgi:enoyl-CoA hydratase